MEKTRRETAKFADVFRHLPKPSSDKASESGPFRDRAEAGVPPSGGKTMMVRKFEAIRSLENGDDFLEHPTAENDIDPFSTLRSRFPDQGALEKKHTRGVTIAKEPPLEIDQT